MLIVFEGIDGVGKSTQIGLLEAHLKAKGKEVVRSFEPTNGVHGRRIREAASKGIRLDKEEELSLFLEDRREHVETLIKPSMREGKVVLLDRYYFSTAAYQGARGYDVDVLLETNEAFAPEPDLLILLDQAPEVSLERVGARGDADAFEALEPLTQCRAIFRSIAKDRSYARVVDASKPLDEVHRAVVQALPGELQ